MIYKGDIQISELKVGSINIVRSILNDKSIYEQSIPDMTDNVIPGTATGPWNNSTLIGDTGYESLESSSPISFDLSKTWNGNPTILVTDTSSGFRLAEDIILDPGTSYMQKAIICAESNWTGSESGPLHSWEGFNVPATAHDHSHFKLGLNGINQSGKANEWTLLYRSITTTEDEGIYYFKPFIYRHTSGLAGKIWVAWHSLEKLKI